MPTPHDKAQEGLRLIDKAILDLLRSRRPEWVTHPEITKQLGIESSYKGGMKGFLSGSRLERLESLGLVERDGHGKGRTSSYRISAKGMASPKLSSS
jgi:DNA-binding IclR family transcriptional regulator